MTKLNLSAGPRFREYLAELDKRIAKLSALRRGEAYLKRIRVPGHPVEAHYVKTYYRTVVVPINKGKKK